MMNVLRKMMAALALVAVAATAQAADDKMKPFVLAYKTKGEVAAVAGEVKQKLAAAGFTVAGEYSPYKDAMVIAITNDTLKKNAGQSDFGGYGAAQRVSVTKNGGDIEVSYTNPTYMAAAYRMKGNLAEVTKQLETALGAQQPYGSEKGLNERKLRKYHYMFGMEYFDDLNAHRIASHKSYDEAVKTVEANLAKGLGGVTKVYRIDIPGKQETVFGVGMKKPQGGDKYMSDEYIMSVIDFQTPKATAHLPYEILVSGKDVYSLYARFRIAIDFPDLSMMGDNSFMNIVESPEALKKALTATAGGQAKGDYWQQ
jgi:uncharacterized protein (DUF302 family)